MRGPRASLIRQHDNSARAVPDTGVIVAKLYDVETGRMNLDERGRGRAHEQFYIPFHPRRRDRRSAR
jgi:hypothetical protein